MVHIITKKSANFAPEHLGRANKVFRPETEVEGDKRFRVVEELGNHEFSVGATPLVALFEVPFNLQFQNQ